MFNGWALFWTPQAEIGTNKAFAKCTTQESAWKCSKRCNILACFMHKNLCVFFSCWTHVYSGIIWENTSETEQRRWTHLIVSGALGLGDELGIADVTIALCEQASIHNARRLHLHLRLQKHTHIHTQTYANMNMIKMQDGIKCQWTLLCVFEMHEHANISI